MPPVLQPVFELLYSVKDFFEPVFLLVFELQAFALEQVLLAPLSAEPVV